MHRSVHGPIVVAITAVGSDEITGPEAAELSYVSDFHSSRRMLAFYPGGGESPLEKMTDHTWLGIFKALTSEGRGANEEDSQKKKTESMLHLP